jgi:CDP-paratose 2-epimerase
MTEELLILGGAGFVGSSLALGLKEIHPDWKIACFDNLSRRGSELNLPRLKQAGIDYVHGDIRCVSDLEVDRFSNVRTLIDCSAEPSVLAGITSPRYVLEANLLGSMNVIEFARRLSARILFMSTSRVYSIPALTSLQMEENSTRFDLCPVQSTQGASRSGIAEEFPVSGHRSLYGTTKLASEMLLEEYGNSFGLAAIVNRCGVLTGPWQMGKVDQGVFVLWVAAHHFGRKLSYIGFDGTGKQVRDLLHIQDLLALVDYQLGHFGQFAGQVFNVGGGLQNSLSLLETTRLCQEITRKTIPVERISENRPDDIPLYVTDNSKVTRMTGWRPQLDPAKALQDIHRWICENEENVRAVLQ